MKWRCICLLLPFILTTVSCKKDLIEPEHVWQLDSRVTTNLNAISFLDNSICIIGGGSTFYRSTVVRSTNGGYSWTADSLADAPKEMYGMSVSADGGVFLSGVDGLVVASKDKGQSWQANRIGNWLTYKGGSFVTADTGIFVSTTLQRQCTITRIDSNYNIIDEQTHLFGLNNIYMTSKDTGYVVGYGAVMKTTDMGDTWQFLNIDNDNFTAMDIHGNTIWMCGANGGIFYSADGGLSWERRRNGNDLALPRYRLRCILFGEAEEGWAAGDDGVLLLTKDGGKHWYRYKQFTSSSIRCMAWCPNGDILVAGDNGTLFRINP